MEVQLHAPILDDILAGWRTLLAEDYVPYRNHCYRVLNFCLALRSEERTAMVIEKISIAAAFHDLGVWTHLTLDYLDPSRQHARAYLAATNRGEWIEEIDAMIEFHHKLRRHTAHPEWLVEPFRRADWIDISRAKVTFGLPPAFLRDTFAQIPSAGFHQRLRVLTRRWIRSHPFRPLPMLRF